MMTINNNYCQLKALRCFEKREAENPNFYRIYGELRFLSSLSNSRAGEYDALITAAAETLARAIADNGCVTPAAVSAAEAALAPLAPEAKAFEFLCVAHAHIDMNWLWGYHETVSVTLSTMETMLTMMKEYPSFTFSQSQASVYKIVQEFGPELLAEIKERIREGRWEVLASTWVETDKNLPSGESLSRHILYTKKYFQKEFGINPDDLVIDFEPDTFGHNRNVPEICASGGVKYYYHCRGQLGEHIVYRWRSPSGAELIVYTEPFWYNADINNTVAEYAPELSRLTLSKTLLKVYGVGDHGGGPTRRDINRFIEMDSWPLYPKFTFGKLKDYFAALELHREKYPLLTDEMNFLCDGCYTTQSRIKAGNRKSERLLADAEFFAAAARQWTGKAYPAELLSSAWEKVLFNHFHDIIPGSGITETREYASALYQQVFAAAESVRMLSQEAIAGRVNLSKYAENPAFIRESRGEGAGAGYSQYGRNAGTRRAYHVFNPLPFARNEVVPVVIWDYEGEIKHIAAEDPAGKTLPVQVCESGRFWGHRFDTVLVRAAVPAAGYTTVFFDEKLDYEPKTSFPNSMRVQSPDEFVLENDLVRAVLNPLDGSVASFVDKQTGTELSSGPGFGIFRLAAEAGHKAITGWNTGMSAWFVGRFKSIENLNRDIEMTPLRTGGLCASWKLSFTFGNNSSIEAVVSLDSGSRKLRYDLTCDWREFGAEKSVPNLHFYMPLKQKPAFLFDLAFGMKERPPVDMDLPAESFVAAKTREPVSLALFSLDKYAFRCREDSLSLTLIRGAQHPDPTPETGRHTISFAIGPVQSAASNEALARESLAFRRPMTVISARSFAAGDSRTGAADLPPEAGFVSIKGGVLSAVKAADASAGGNRIVFRVYEVEGKAAKSEITLGVAARSARLTDVLEESSAGTCALSPDGKTVSFDLPANSVRTVVVELA